MRTVLVTHWVASGEMDAFIFDNIPTNMSRDALEKAFEKIYLDEVYDGYEPAEAQQHAAVTLCEQYGMTYTEHINIPFLTIEG